MPFDLLIRNATVYPGEGLPMQADVGVTEGVIAAVASGLLAEARRVVEGQGLLLTPGLIDMHAHSALEPFSRPELAPKVAQGFTTEVIHPDGLAPAPVRPEWVGQQRAYLQALEGPGPEEWKWSAYSDYLDALHDTHPATTLVPSVGHNAIRAFVIGGENRVATPGELAAMRREVRSGLEAGARTVSFGLIYLPGAFAPTSELIELAREAALFGAPLVPHMRNEGAGVLEAVDEMIEVARQSGAPLHISHLKVIGNRRLIEPLLERIDRAGNEIDISFDQYPYGAGSTLLSALLPAWAQEGGASRTLARLREAAERRAIARDVARGLPGWENIYRSCGPENVVIAGAAAARADDIGKTLARIGEERGQDPFEAALDLLLETELDVSMIDHYAAEDAVRTIFRHSRALVGSDAIFSARPHPRLYGTAPRVLGRYALRERVIPVEEAVARLTARAARRLGLHDRGRIALGLRADLVLISPKEYIDTATYDEPAQFPPGVRGVWVAGQEVWNGTEASGNLPGGVWREPWPRL